MKYNAWVDSEGWEDFEIEARSIEQAYRQLEDMVRNSNAWAGGSSFLVDIRVETIDSGNYRRISGNVLANVAPKVGAQ